MIDTKAILKEYDIDESDFGFTSVSEDEFSQTIDDATAEAQAQTAEQYKAKLLEVEKLIMPFLGKLLKSTETYIKWPPEVRKPVIEKQIEKILKITRS